MGKGVICSFEGEGRKGIEVPGHLKGQFDEKLKKKNEFYAWKAPQK